MLHIPAHKNTTAPAAQTNAEPARDAAADAACCGPVRCPSCDDEDEALVEDVARRQQCLVRDYPY